MIVIIILSILFIISLVWFIIADIVVCDLDFGWRIGLPLSCTSISCMTLFLCGFVALSNNSASEIQTRRRELQTRYEILNEVKEKPYAYSEIIDYNDEVESAQKYLESPWTNWLYCPAYKDVQCINMKEVEK